MIKLKNILKESKTPVREGYSTEEKRIVMMAVRKIAKYMNRDLATAFRLCNRCSKRTQKKW